MAAAGISGRAVGLAAAGGLFVYAGLRGESPLESLRGILTGSPAPVPSGTPVSLSLPSDTASRTGVPASAVAGRAADIALQQVGKPYRWSASGPNAFDCSGLVSYAFNHAGASGFGRMTTPAIAISAKFRKISRGDVQKGDLLWKLGHVAIAISNTQLVEAPRTGIPVRTRSISGFSMYLRYVGTGSTTPPPSVRNPKGRVGR
jgi:cell wall-associated NlpC family hydrolase